MQTAFLITARLKSKRLPKKILLEVKGFPLIVHMINRIKHAKKINKIIICTSTNSQDNPLVEIANQENIDCYRGSEDDVLVRLFDASKKFNLNNFANMTADIPMIDPFIIDQSVETYNQADVDLLIPEKNSFGGCFVVRVSSLDKICQIKKEIDTEVWVKFFRSQKDFSIHTLKIPKDSKQKFLKTSLDYIEDYFFIQKIFDELYKNSNIFTNKDIVDLVKKNPGLAKINSDRVHIKRWKDHIANLKK